MVEQAKGVNVVCMESLHDFVNLNVRSLLAQRDRVLNVNDCQGGCFLCDRGIKSGRVVA